MKTSIYILFSLMLFVSCSQNKSINDDLGISQQQIEEVEKASKPFDMNQLRSSEVSGNYLYAIRMYLENGEINPDSTAITKKEGKFNAGLPRADFQIVYADQNNKQLGVLNVENIFKIRSCDEGGKKGYLDIDKSWIEIYLPYREDLMNITFVESGKERNQELNLAKILNKDDEDQDPKQR